MNICIIPARGGSKRIARKNIKDFHGKPIIAYSIEAALKAKCFEKIIVSTDDDEIADISKHWGAEVPFVRPDNISGDYATTLDVVKHTNSWCKKHGLHFNKICCIYATAPFIEVSDILNGLKLLEDPMIQYAFAATSFGFSIQRAFFLDELSQCNMFQPKYLNTRSQDLIDAYHDAGQFYWGKSSAFEESLPIFAPHSKPVILPRYRVQDIDTPLDWEVAEMIYKLLFK